MRKATAYHLSTDAQPIPKQQLPHGQLPTDVKFFSHCVIFYGISLWPVGCPDSILCQLLVPPQQPWLAGWKDSTRSWKILGSVQLLLSNNWNIGVLSVLFFSHSQNIALYETLWRKNQLYPSWNLSIPFPVLKVSYGEKKNPTKENHPLKCQCN